MPLQGPTIPDVSFIIAGRLTVAADGLPFASRRLITDCVLVEMYLIGIKLAILSYDPHPSGDKGKKAFREKQQLNSKK